MNYYVFPIVQGENTQISLFPEAVPLDAALAQIREKVHSVNTQGFWRNDRGQHVKPEYISFHIISEIERYEMLNEPLYS